MTRFAALVALLLACPCLAPAAVIQHPLRNRDFAAGSFAFWTVDAGYTRVMDQAYAGFTAEKGSDYALLGTRFTQGTLAQTFTDAAGETARLGFWLESDGGTPNDFSASFDGNVLLSLTDVPADGWVFYSAIVHTSGLDTLSFSFRDDPGYLALDNITLLTVKGHEAVPEAAIPEPASFGLLAAALAALGRVWGAARGMARKQGSASF